MANRTIAESPRLAPYTAQAKQKDEIEKEGAIAENESNDIHLADVQTGSLEISESE